MKIEDQVCTIEQAKELKNLGIQQKEDCHYKWFEVSNGDDEGNFEAERVEWSPVLTQYSRKDKEYYSIGIIDGELTTSDGQFCSYKPETYQAFTVAELGEILIDNNDKWFIGSYYNNHLGVWMCEIGIRNDEADGEISQQHAGTQEGETEAEVRSDMLIYLLEEKFITIEEVNNSL